MARGKIAAKVGRAACPHAAEGGVLAAKNAEGAKIGRAACPHAAEGGVLAAKNAKSAKAMKPSGVAWLGDIPEGWEVLPARHLFIEVTAKNKNGKYTRQLSFRYGEIVDKGPNQSHNAFPEETVLTYTVVEPDTIMINGLNLNYDLLSLRVAIVKEVGIITSAYLAVVPQRSRIIPGYALYLLKAYDFKMVFHGQGSGIRMTLKFADFATLPIVLPSLSEQRAIADYLDEKCGVIDAAIAEAKKGIEEYKAWKKSLIFEAVTGKRRVGVFNAEKREAEKIKPSGIPWIGAIPEGWRVMKLRRLGTFANGISKGGEFFGKGSPFVSYSDVYKNEALPTVVKGLLLSTPEEQERYSVEKGDVFFTRTSETIDEIGFASTCLENISQATFAGFLIRFRPTGHDILPCFSKYYFRNKLVSEYFAKELVMVTRASLGQELLKSLPVLLPPIPEQLAIADYLDEKCAAIDAMVAEKEALIADLESYKKSLIYETVTGKREVA